ncbi:hypothetical protein CMI49_01850 [Candidatus Pacearchaeota archaeon]|jgi:transcription factor E|nr:hypothetical protein [Candidatus Pacearchaeota archaeon]|tara:strand:+ start:40 stop:765 length:726 start_codon:yes stop_codon:yes gene_type:complete
MLKKFLKEVVVIVVGRPVEEIVDLLDSKKHVNEFIIAKKMDITINQTRNILYKLSDSGLVSSIRKKDKRKGWYTYFWKIEIFKSLEFLRNTLEKRIDQLNHQIRSREIKQFYICERCNIEFNEENALLHDFTCNECGNIFSIRDNTKVLREFKKNLNKLEKELDFVEEEVKKEKEKIGKIKLKEIKKQEKLRLEKRKATRKKKKIKKKIKKPIKKKKKIKKKIRKNPKIKKIKKKTKKKRR